MFPDLLVELDPRVEAVTALSPATLMLYRRLVANHERAGVLIGAGPSLAQRAGRSDASVLDIAPTVLHMLGEPPTVEMDGRVQSELLAR